ncbi:DUF5686 and carboxypeptidase-like regulatory domain-containing protein [Flavobacterium sp. CS20]|jgi:hypothetical protein|uniref:DUF5686 and carboxypeptidase-like regulatory domain-containing protein n=1 Tax=Flavobacterium sp. CS20 TaxID=2775246 RepID=UPI001B39E583|nr:DUF5686 and carboxypeptidase-like regulatory domain-containing protein [Flavobacterium sp. CS20]QTY26776.1 carboxypeptidase-like regulatory domain-containing protein [Flavobacterium sp. CS20]
MNKFYFTYFVLFCGFLSLAQTKVSGYVYDESDEPVPYANVIFKDSRVGTITDENGKFYLQSDNDYEAIEVSFMGYKTYTLPLNKSATYDIEIKLESDAEALSEVTIYTGKTSKKNNPAIDILRKIWENRRDNGVKKFKQYQYDKYEKIQFDLNTIDSALIKSRLFKGMEFIFTQTDTNEVTGKTYLPIFINESVSKVYGDNIIDKEKEVLQGNKNSGFSNNQNLIAFIKDLYAEYNVYDNYIKIFDKSFVSPLSTTGIDNYNYVLADSTFIGNKWTYHIVYYPRRKNELTFKGDFWVNDTTWAIKKINLAMTKSANINWVKDVYIEQEFDVLNDSIFLMTRDYFMTDFTFRKKEDSRGVYGKRTTLYDNYKFDVKKDKEFYDRQTDPYKEQVFNRDSIFWAKNRLEPLNKDEKEIYTLVDTLKTVKAFKQVYDVATVLATNYYGFDGWDFGPVFSTFGYNDIEGLRLRVGGRTYFSQNDTWRLQGFTAYGFKDDKFKYGISGKVMLDRKSRLILSAGNRRDVEQLGGSLTSSNDVLGRSLLSGTPLTLSANNTLTNINLSSLALQFDPFYNFNLRLEGNYRTLVGADTNVFSLAFYTDEARTQRQEKITQTELSLTANYTPNRKATGYGVEQYVVNPGKYPEFMLKYSKGLKGVIDSDFDYDRLQLLYRQPILMGGFGRFTSTIEAGKTFGGVPLGLLNVVPGNETLFSIEGTFPLLDYYEFVTDEYVSLHMEHNFNGRLFARIPLLRDLDLREIVTFRSMYGKLSNESIMLNASTSNPVLLAPDQNVYYSYSFGIGNIFRVFRIDFHFRGNYFDIQDSRTFGITGAFGFYF